MKGLLLGVGPDVSFEMFRLPKTSSTRRTFTDLGYDGSRPDKLDNAAVVLGGSHDL